MPVMIDQELLAADDLGLTTVGHVLSHVRRQERLVVNLMIDGRAPDLTNLWDVQQSALGDRVVFVETADPAEMAREVLDEVETSLADADANKIEAAELLQVDDIPKAMDRLRMFFSTWQIAEDSVVKIVKLIGLSPADVRVDGRPMPDVVADFTSELKAIRQALQDRDYVLLGDLLTYETSESTRRWSSVLDTLRKLAA